MMGSWKKGSIAAGVAVLFIAGFLSINSLARLAAPQEAFVSQTSGDDMGTGELASSGVPDPISPPVPTKNPTVTIDAVGDVMMHEGQIWSGYDSETGTYDYSGFFQDIKQEISSADIAMANLETTLGGKESEYTGYPRFNSPDELADALKDAGFDVIVTANNHCLDRGEKGALRTIDVLEQRGLTPVGTSRTPEERERVAVKEINGVKIAFLAYTYGTNGNPIPEDKPYLVNLTDEDAILKDLARARESADAVVVYLHFGQEYQRTASSQQKQLARLLLEKEADVVIGSHPHVTQPGEWISVTDAGGESAPKYAAYSLGNFISAQRFPYTEEGMILKITIEKDLHTNRVIVKDVKEIPTWVDKFKKDGRMRYVVRLGKKSV